MTKISVSGKHLVFSFLLGAASTSGAYYLLADNSAQQQILSLENQVKSLEIALAEQEKKLRKPYQLTFPTNNPARQKIGVNTAAKTDTASPDNAEQPAIEAVTNNLDALKDFETKLLNDPNSAPEKIDNLLADSPTKDKIAIVSKTIFDMASDREGLPDYVLESIYSEQTDPDLKRIAAQILSQRGNNTLMDNHIADLQTGLKSAQPTARQQALVELAKTHSAYAADVIAPLLQDPDINVKLDALLALRATGNQTHISQAERLLGDPEPAVSSLARDVVNSLRNLSDSARTNLTIADIAAELPPVEN